LRVLGTYINKTKNISSCQIVLSYHGYFLNVGNTMIPTTNFEYKLQHLLLYSVKSKQRQGYFVIIYFCAIFDFPPFKSQKPCIFIWTLLEGLWEGKSLFSSAQYSILILKLMLNQKFVPKLIIDMLIIGPKFFFSSRTFRHEFRRVPGPYIFIDKSEEVLPVSY
jgi:hypothetical protein